jgi:hypothetical protein
MKILNYINGEWVKSTTNKCLDVINEIARLSMIECGKTFMHVVEFFTQKKVVVERWPKEWSRKF